MRGKAGEPKGTPELRRPRSARPGAPAGLFSAEGGVGVPNRLPIAQPAFTIIHGRFWVIAGGSGAWPGIPCHRPYDRGSLRTPAVCSDDAALGMPGVQPRQRRAQYGI